MQPTRPIYAGRRAMRTDESQGAGRTGAVRDGGDLIEPCGLSRYGSREGRGGATGPAQVRVRGACLLRPHRSHASMMLAIHAARRGFRCTRGGLAQHTTRLGHARGAHGVVAVGGLAFECHSGPARADTSRGACLSHPWRSVSFDTPGATICSDVRFASCALTPS